MSGWIGVDLDGTLAEDHGWPADGSIGAPIPAMVERVRAWLAEGKDVRIFTARVWTDGEPRRHIEAKEAELAIQAWSRAHIGRALPITCVKDFGMVRLYDDRCVQVEENTGRLIGDDPVTQSKGMKGP